MTDKYSYRVTWSEDDNEFVGLCAEFPSLSWLANSQDEAFKGIRKLVIEVVKDLEKQNEPIPDAIASKNYSGKFMIRVPPSLHRELVLEAQEAHVSLNRYINMMLASFAFQYKRAEK